MRRQFISTRVLLYFVRVPRHLYLECKCCRNGTFKSFTAAASQLTSNKTNLPFNYTTTTIATPTPTWPQRSHTHTQVFGCMFHYELTLPQTKGHHVILHLQRSLLPAKLLLCCLCSFLPELESRVLSLKLKVDVVIICASYFKSCMRPANFNTSHQSICSRPYEQHLKIKCSLKI